MIAHNISLSTQQMDLITHHVTRLPHEMQDPYIAALADCLRAKHEYTDADVRAALHEALIKVWN